MATTKLEDLTEDVKREYGFSDTAWEMFSDAQVRCMDLDNEVSALRDIARRAAVLVRWFSREDWPHVVFSADEIMGMDRDAQGLADALKRASYYQEGWGE